MPLEARIKYDYRETVPGPGRYDPSYKLTKPHGYTFVMGEKFKTLTLNLLTGTDKVVGPGKYDIVYSMNDLVGNSKKENIGIGTNLLNEVEKAAMINNCKKIRLITTNDNLRALQFYQKRGYCLTKLYPNAMEEVRKVKPNVPEIGDNDIPLRDEIELEKQL